MSTSASQATKHLNQYEAAEVVLKEINDQIRNELEHRQFKKPRPAIKTENALADVTKKHNYNTKIKTLHIDEEVKKKNEDVEIKKEIREENDIKVEQQNGTTTLPNDTPGKAEFRCRKFEFAALVTTGTLENDLNPEDIIHARFEIGGQDFDFLITPLYHNCFYNKPMKALKIYQGALINGRFATDQLIKAQAGLIYQLHIFWNEWVANFSFIQSAAEKLRDGLIGYHIRLQKDLEIIDLPAWLVAKLREYTSQREFLIERLDVVRAHSVITNEPPRNFSKEFIDLLKSILGDDGCVNKKTIDSLCITFSNLATLASQTLNQVEQISKIYSQRESANKYRYFKEYRTRNAMLIGAAEVQLNALAGQPDIKPITNDEHGAAGVKPFDAAGHPDVKLSIDEQAAAVGINQAIGHEPNQKEVEEKESGKKLGQTNFKREKQSDEPDINREVEDEEVVNKQEVKRVKLEPVD